MRTGFVYLIGPEEGGPVKIGHATNVKSRLCSLQIGNWRPLSILHSVTVPWFLAPTIEREMHLRFADRSMRGEWFDAQLEDVKAALEEVASSYVEQAATSDRFSAKGCYASCDEPHRVFHAVSLYRSLSANPANGSRITQINRSLLEVVGQASYIMFQTVIVEGRDIGHAVHGSARLARQAEDSLVKALNAFPAVWARSEEKRIRAVDFPSKAAA